MTIRSDQLGCGTSTTGTGTLTCAAPPTGINAVDPYAAFSGSGFGTSVGVPVLYSIVEYTDSTFGKPKQSESGRGTFLIGGSLTASTLARTQIFQTAASMDSQPATNTGMNTASPTAITIGTAANVVIWFGDLSWVPMEAMTAVATSGVTSIDNLGFCGDTITTAGGQNLTLTSGRLHHCRVAFRHSMFIKSLSLYLQTNFAGTSNTLDCAMYDIGSDGRPGKRLLTFAQGTTLNTGNTITVSATTGLFFHAGVYYASFLYVGVGQTTAPAIRLVQPCAASPLGMNNSSVFGPCGYATVNSQSAGTLADPATLTSLTAANVATEPLLIFRST